MKTGVNRCTSRSLGTSDETVFNPFSPACLETGYIEGVRSPKVNSGGINN